MNQWKIEYYVSSAGKSDVERWFGKLVHEQKSAVAKEIRMLAKSGNELQLPHSKSLGKGLFELRERRYGYRIYYAFQGDRVIILLTAGDKSSQKNDIERARKRLDEL